MCLNPVAGHDVVSRLFSNCKEGRDGGEICHRIMFLFQSTSTLRSLARVSPEFSVLGDIHSELSRTNAGKL